MNRSVMESGRWSGSLRTVDASYVDEVGEVRSFKAAAKRCVAYGPGLAGGAAGEAQHFALILADEHGEKLGNNASENFSDIKVDVHEVLNTQIMPPFSPNSGEFKYSVVDLKDGSYSVSFYIAKVGEFLLHVRVDGENVAGSPFKVRIRPGKPNPASTQVLFDRMFRVLPGSLVELIEPLHNRTQIENELKIVTCDALGNRTYSARAPVAARGGGGVKIRDLVDFQDGNFSAFLEISADGRLDILVDGVHVRGSPFTVRVPSGTSGAGGLDGTTGGAWRGGSTRGYGGNFEEVLLGEREEAVEEGERRLAELKREVDEKYRKFPIISDYSASRPPQPVQTKPPVVAETSEGEKKKSVEFVKEMETRLATLRAKEEEVEKLLAEVNREKLEAEEERGRAGRREAGGAGDSVDGDEEVRRLKAIYARKDEWLERRREEVEKLVKRREKEKVLEDWSLDETMNKVGFIKQSKIRMEKEYDAASKIKYTVDWIYANFASSEKTGISMTDAVTLVHKAKLPMDSAEVVDAFIEFIKEVPAERVVSRQKLLKFLAFLAKLTYRDPRDVDDQLASLFEEYLFPLVIKT